MDHDTHDIHTKGYFQGLVLAFHLPIMLGVVQGGQKDLETQVPCDGCPEGLGPTCISICYHLQGKAKSLYNVINEEGGKSLLRQHGDHGDVHCVLSELVYHYQDCA